MKRWLGAVAAVALTVGIAGPVAAKAASSSRSAKVTAPAKAAPVAVKAPAKTAGITTKSRDRGCGGCYPGPYLPKVKTEPRYVKLYRSSPSSKYEVKVEYFCARTTVELTASPSLAGFPVSKNTDRYGKAEFSLPVTGNSVGRYTITATQHGGSCELTASTTFDVKNR